jgi:hypothetical protein
VTGVQIDTSVQQDGGRDEAGSESKRPSLLGRLFGPVADLAENDPQRLNRLFTDRLAKSVILLVPIFAALLRGLYRRRRYVAHLIFSLHLHSFAFLAILVGTGLDLALTAVTA